MFSEIWPSKSLLNSIRPIMILIVSERVPIYAAQMTLHCNKLTRYSTSLRLLWKGRLCFGSLSSLNLLSRPAGKFDFCWSEFLWFWFMKRWRCRVTGFCLSSMSAKIYDMAIKNRSLVIGEWLTISLCRISESNYVKFDNSEQFTPERSVGSSKIDSESILMHIIHVN